MFVRGNHYLQMLRPDGSRKRTFTHILVAEKALGKRLPKGAVVHHADGNRKNNDPSNLVICPSQSYHNILHARMRVRDAGGNPNTELICSRCRAVKPLDEFHKKAGHYAGRHDTCKKCRVRVVVEAA